MGSEEGGLTGDAGARHVAYVVSRYPKLTETFVLYEALALQELGVRVSLFPLITAAPSDQGDAVHTEAAAFEAHVVRLPSLSGSVVWSCVATALRRPVAMARAVVGALRGAGMSTAHLARAVAVFPKTVHMARRMQALGVQHVHAHFANHPALTALVVHELTGIPFSFTAHGSDLHRNPSGLRAKVLGAARTIAVSEYNRRFILEHAGADLASRVQVLHCGADLQQFRQGRAVAGPASVSAAAPTDNGAESPLRIACVAALRKVKGHVHLLDGLALLRRRGVPFECRLAGSGPLESELRSAIAARELTDHVQLLGPRSRDQIADLLAWADVLTLTSVIDAQGRREGIPVSLMEGMAAGLPVVASRQSGIPELVEHGESGFLCEPGDSASIADALARVDADRDQARAMGARGRERVQRDFDLHANARKLAGSILEL